MKPKSQLLVASLGIGHGDATLITFVHLDRRWNCLIDGGESPARLKTALDEAWQRHGNTPQKEIDLLVTSHFDSDHIAGLDEITEHCKIHHYLAPMLPAYLRHEWLFGPACQQALARGEHLEH